jgi:hypothetical protein
LALSQLEVLILLFVALPPTYWAAHYLWRWRQRRGEDRRSDYATTKGDCIGQFLRNHNELDTDVGIGFFSRIDVDGCQSESESENESERERECERELERERERERERESEIWFSSWCDGDGSCDGGGGGGGAGGGDQELGELQQLRAQLQQERHKVRGLKVKNSSLKRSLELEREKQALAEGIRTSFLASV